VVILLQIEGKNMQINEFRSLSRGDQVYCHGNGYGVIHATFMQGNFKDSLVYVDIKLENDMFVTAISENNAMMVEKA